MDVTERHIRHPREREARVGDPGIACSQEIFIRNLIGLLMFTYLQGKKMEHSILA